MKVKSIFKGIEKRNSAWEPITKQKLAEETAFFTKIVAWMAEVGKMRAKNGKIQGILANIICNSSVRQLSFPRRRTRLRFTTNGSLGLFTEKIFARYRYLRAANYSATDTVSQSRKIYSGKMF